MLNSQEFLRRLDIGDKVRVIASYEDFDPHDDFDDYVEELIGEVGTIVGIDYDWYYPVHIEFDSEEAQEISFEHGAELFHQDMIEWV